jgi:hypothetical protein
MTNPKSRLYAIFGRYKSEKIKIRLTKNGIIIVQVFLRVVEIPL